MRWAVIRTAFLLSLTCPLAVAGQTSSTERPVDVVLVLDNSASMKKADPQGLMRQAVTQFAAQLPGSARLGIVLFDNDVEVLVGLTAAGEPNFAAQIDNAVRRLDYSGQLTDIPAGIERALYELRERGRDDARKTIVFFTDGIVDVGGAEKNLERARWLRDQLAQDARRGSIAVFGIAFTEAADFELIQSVAQITGAEYFRVLAASDIGGTFERIGGRLREPVQIPVVTSPPASSTAAVAVPAPATSPWWPWVLGIALALSAGAAVAVRRRVTSSPDVGASVRDLGGHTGTHTHRLDKRTVRIGREARTNDIVIPHETVSSQHAVIEFRDGSFYLRDLRSSNGTFVKGKKISDSESIREVPLKHGDRVRFDAYEFEFCLDSLADVRKTRLADEAPVSTGGTRLRAPSAASVADPPAPSPVQMADEARATPGPPVGRLSAQQDESEAKTRLKAGMCPNHPAWKATELCPLCKQAFCKNCITEKSGRRTCVDCAKALTA
jgi:pSer/pThr/pTyr-binding forkhead associated (FHA) protein/Mg-chelatase subunit ChlD